ncbi:hypothetical protein HAHE_35930 [Haloferula helveola]|uniref:DUF2905 domain-containing protein n=1 Tax=Haloferula helveola TaxID=490095 RepID=A0ABN6HFB0_9BACT|nr:hypothetical protein HAHE_35930 [Haloferula helveola]
MSALGKALVVFGVVAVVIGLALWFGGRWFGWLGKLPGDIRIEGDKGGFYFPVVTCIVISVVATIVLSLIRRFFGN